MPLFGCLCLLLLCRICSAWDADPLFDICDNGIPDVVVTTANGTHCLLKGEHFFVIDVVSEEASAALMIESRWRGLPGYVDLAFTLTDVYWSDFNDMTIFVIGKKYYVYKDFEFQKEGNTVYWEKVSNDSSPNEEFYDQVIHQKRDSVVSFRSRKMFELVEVAMLFDDLQRPEKMQVTRVTRNLHSSVQSILDSSQAFYFIPSVGQTFHLYWIDSSGSEGLYCILPNFDSPVSCLRRPSHVSGMLTLFFMIVSGNLVRCKGGHQHVQLPARAESREEEAFSGRNYQQVSCSDG